MGLAGKPYRPSNGEDGRQFMRNWCDMCVHDHAAHMSEDGSGCVLIVNAMLFRVGEEGYPEEWRYLTAAQVDELTYGTGNVAMPGCTKFEADGCS